MSSQAERDAGLLKRCTEGDPKLFDKIKILTQRLTRMQETNKLLLRKLRINSQRGSPPPR